LRLFHLLILHRLVNGGILAPNDPKRRYKYQLLDPAEKPYATIRFYYRSLAFLTANGIVSSPSNHSRQTSTTSDSSRISSNFSNSVSRNASKASSSRSPARSEVSASTGSSRDGSPPTDSVANWLRYHRLQKYTAVLAQLSFDTLVTFSDDGLSRLGVAAQGARCKLLRELAAYKQQHLNQVEDAEGAKYQDGREREHITPFPAPEATTSCSSSSTGSSTSSKSEYVGYRFGNPQTNPSLRVITKDSIKDLPLRSPPEITLSAPPEETIFSIENSPLSSLCETACSAPAHKTNFTTEEVKRISPIKSASLISPIPPPSPIKSPKKPRKSLKVQINGGEFELETETKRPLSPFTSGGVLRRLLSPLPPSAPARITEFGPTVDDEVEGMLAEMESGGKGKTCVTRTTRKERGGGILRRILGKRIGRG
jgi:hypothetical protein